MSEMTPPMEHVPYLGTAETTASSVPVFSHLLNQPDNRFAKKYGASSIVAPSFPCDPESLGALDDGLFFPLAE